MEGYAPRIAPPPSASASTDADALTPASTPARPRARAPARPHTLLSPSPHACASPPDFVSLRIVQWEKDNNPDPMTTGVEEGGIVKYVAVGLGCFGLGILNRATEFANVWPFTTIEGWGQ